MVDYNGAVAAIVALIVGVGVATLVLIFVGSLGGQTYELVESDLDAINDYVDITGDTFTALNGTAVALDYTALKSGTLTIANTTGSAVAITNFTVNYAAGTVTLLYTTYNNTALVAAYTYDRPTIKNSVKSSILSGFSALEDTGSYVPIVVLAIIIAVVLALVLGMQGMYGGRGGAAF